MSNIARVINWATVPLGKLVRFRKIVLVSTTKQSRKIAPASTTKQSRKTVLVSTTRKTQLRHMDVAMDIMGDVQIPVHMRVRPGDIMVAIVGR